MQIPCPSCKATMTARVAKPGTYTPNCPKCGAKFQLVVPEDAGGTVQVRRIVSASGRVPAPGPRKSAAVPKPPPRTPAAESTQAFAPPADADDGHESGSYSATEMTVDFTPSGRIAPPKPRPTPAAADATGDFTPPPAAAIDADSPTSADATGDFTPRPAGDDTAALPERSAAGKSRASAAAAGVDATTDFAGEPDPKPKKKGKKKGGPPELPERLGGYAVQKPLGQGGMGAVYLARQLSLDRPVALKVMNPQWAEDPVFLARFVREAYAAAQLNHHNVVQIYDIGADAGVNFFSMEFVDGKSLGDVLRKAGQLDPPAAVGYTLQAARGLKFAHDRGMVHRDVKPDNLMLNGEGIVKVADLGLVKTRDMTAADDAGPAAGGGGDSEIKAVARTDVTAAGTAMGSPSYMAPEQCRDAAAVDPRADIYSLGCSLYALLAGRAPFQGATAVEVISKHLTEPPPPLDGVVKGLPRGLSDLVGRCLAKDPADRFQTMDDLIAALKGWQEQQTAGPPRPTEEQIAAFEEQAAAVGAAPLPKLAATLAAVMPAAAGVVGLGLLFVQPTAAVGLLIAVAAAVLTGFVAGGVLTGSHLFSKVREWAFGARIVDWLTVAGAVGLLLAALYLAGLLLVGLVAAAAGGLLGAGFAFGVSRTVANQRRAAREEFDAILRRLRLAGLDEDAVRGFVVQASGDDWEAVYELLFGYPAKLQMRAALAEKGERRPTAGAWRDGLVRRLDAAIQARAEARSKKRLRTLEVKRLMAEGLSAAEARAQAETAAEDLVEQAATIRAANAGGRAVNVRQMLTRYERAKLSEINRPRKSAVAKLVGTVGRLLTDPRPRLLLGAAVAVGGLMWVRQNDAVFKGSVAVGSASSGQAAGVLDLAGRLWEPGRAAKPLQASLLPGELAGLFDSVNPILAGLLLVLGAFSGRTVGVALTLAGAAVALAGHKLGLPIPAAGGLTPQQLTLAAGAGLGLVGLVLGRR